MAPVCALSLAMLVMLAGCSSSHEAPERAPTAVATHGRADAARHLAYEHAVDVDTAPDRVPVVVDAVLGACRGAAANACTVLDSRIDAQPEAGATLKLRARADIIPKLLAALGQKAELTRQSTRAEDLSGPIMDTARQLAMLDDYRNRLEALRNRAGSDIDAMIKVNHELAEVQSTYEAIDGKRAVLARRVETELLAVSIRSDRHQPFWAPIRRALGDFGGNLAQGISSAISGLAYLLPWLVVLAIMGWAARKLWRWRRGGRAAGPG